MLWIVPLALGLACGSKPSMMVLEDKVFDLVPAEDRAVLDAPRNAVKDAEQRRDEAVKAPSKSGEDLSKAKKEKDRAEKAAEAARAKLDLLQASVDWLKAEAEASEREVDAAKAKYQWERARLAEAKGLKPYEKFDAKKFESQSLDYQKAFVNAQIASRKKKDAMDDAMKRYEKAQKAADKAKDD